MHTKTILVVGGAGFIGSHMALYLHELGYRVLVLDNLVTGHQDAVIHAELIHGDMADSNLLDHVFSTNDIAAVIHFASLIQVGDSVIHPERYYQNNVVGTLTLLSAMLKWKVSKFIFSSTAAVYGETNAALISESHPCHPINPYGHSKRMIETILADYFNAYDFDFIVLRYFNAAGADPKGRLQERHSPETHLIPLILQVAQGLLPHVTLFGHDYPTIDGTCVRDYIHVTDLCVAHALALAALFSKQRYHHVFNVGTGQGYSVQQVIEMARIVTGAEIPVVNGLRRPGDPACLVADPSSMMSELHWEPRYSDLRTIIEHAWNAVQQSDLMLSTVSVDKCVNIR